MTLIGVISDTHGLLRSEVYGAFEDVDEIVHAGDVGDPAILTELEVIAPVRAVFGNVDGWEVRETLEETVELAHHGNRVVVVHGDQWGSPSGEDLVRRYPDHDVVIYGHTHRPLIQLVAGVLLVNPGSAGPRRFDVPVTVALLELASERRPDARIVELG